MPANTMMLHLAVLFNLAVSNAQASELATALRSGDLARAGNLVSERSVSLDDADDSGARCRLLLFKNLGRDAIACYRAELTRSPNDKAALSGLAFAAWRVDDFETAADAHGKAGRLLREAEARALLVGGGAYKIANPQPEYVAPFVSEDPLPVLRVHLADGADHLFVLDTGAAETLIDPQLAKLVGVEEIAGISTGVFAGGQTAQVRFGVIPKLALGDLEIGRLPVQLQSTAGFSAALGGAKIEGVIGVDILRHFIATIDYPGKRLLLRTMSSTRPRSAGVPMWMADDHLLLTAATIDSVPELALIDTGLAGQGCTLPSSTLERIAQTPDGKSVSGVGGGGVSSAVGFSAKDIQIGPADERDVACLFGPFPPSLETSSGTRIGLLVSHAFLKPYVVTFDFQTMRLELRKPS